MLLRLPDFPSPAAVITELKKEPILTLSPKQLPENKTISVSFSLSYKYLSTKEKIIGQVLSNFPGSFSIEACAAVILFQNKSYAEKLNITKNAVKVLVQRSLLEYSHDDGRYLFHNLIRDYFLKKQEDSVTDTFIQLFQNYFFRLLRNASDIYITVNYSKNLLLFLMQRGITS